VASTDATGVDAWPPADLAERVAAADVVLLDGHHPALASAAASAGSAARVSVVLDGGSWKPVVGEVAPVLHSAVCSEVFRLPGDRPASDLRGLGVPRVAVTRGPRSVRWCTAAGAGEVAVPPVQVRDTLAAGDAFHGAYAYVVGLRPDGPFPRALELAERVASFRCTVVGSRAWLATPAFVVLAKEVQRSASSSPTRRAEGQNRGTEDDILGYGPEGV
jgi:sugar/nucleoside kinase (ribokinase family)